MNDYLYDIISEQIMDSDMVDKIEWIETASYDHPNRVHGYKDDEPVHLSIWFDEEAERWYIEYMQFGKEY